MVVAARVARHLCKQRSLAQTSQHSSVCWKLHGSMSAFDLGIFGPSRCRHVKASVPKKQTSSTNVKELENPGTCGNLEHSKVSVQVRHLRNAGADGVRGGEVEGCAQHRRHLAGGDGLLVHRQVVQPGKCMVAVSGLGCASCQARRHAITRLRRFIGCNTQFK